MRAAGRLKVVIGGASGYVGGALVAALLGDGHEVVALSRRTAPLAARATRVAWDQLDAALDGADAVVNLAGEPIGAPFWTPRRKQAIRSSRIETTRSLAEAIASSATRPRVLVTASGIDYYGDTGDALADESAPPGRSFLAQVCVAWEAAAAAAPIRHVAIRTSLVIGPGAQALRLMALPFRFFVGGPLGSGRQFFPWIHRDDLVGLYRLALEDGSLSGPLNAVAPEQLRQRDAARELGAVLRRPALVPTPAFVLRLALGEQADLLLHGQRAVSRRLDGFDFRYEELRPALVESLAR
jgi:uncharacterized protein (TIGR01777 family)